MKFDLLSLGDHLPDPHTRRYNETQTERYRFWTELGVRGEVLGYDAFWIGEHHCTDYIVSSPQMVLAAIASRTSHISLGTAVSLLPTNDPVRLAEDFLTFHLVRHADRVLVLDRGALLAEGAPEAVRADPRVRAVYLGSGATQGGH